MNVCRTCLNKNNLKPLFESGFDVNKRSLDLYRATGVKIKLNDGLTQLICSACTKFINTSLRLRRQSLRTDKLLRKTIESNEKNNVNSGSDSYSQSNDINSGYSDLELQDTSLDTYPQNVSEYIKYDIPKFDNVLDGLRLSPTLDGTCKIPDSGKRLTIKDLESSDDECHDFYDDDKEWGLSSIEKEKICRQKDEKLAISNAITRKCMELAVQPYDRSGPIKCRLCSKQLKNIPIFKCHAKTHFDPEFSCEICGKKFVFNSVLRYHQQRVHGKLKRLACGQCAYRAVDLQQLQNHVRAAHTGERPYSCDECGDTFRVRSTLAQHMRRHFGVKNVQCERCPAMFRSRSELSWHRNKVHLMIYTYFCYMCPQSYKNLGSVKKHLLKVHGVPLGQHLPIKSVRELR